MKIKVAVLDHDIEFMDRLAKIFQQKYADRISLSLFSNEDTLYEGLKTFHADIVLFDEFIQIKEECIPDGVTAGYFSAIPDVDEIGGIPAICRYQKAEMIYKMILGLYAENLSDVKLKKSKTEVQTVLFTSVQGGAGTSAAAAAYALSQAEKKKKLFYLCLQKFGNPELYFHGEGKLSFSDVVYSLKSRKGNLLIKLESAAQTDPSGVDFFSSCKNTYDMFELSDDEVRMLIQGLMQSAKYEEIVIDLSGEMTERMVMLMQDYADRIIYVSDGSTAGNQKFESFCETAGVMEQRQECEILSKACLLYSRFSSKSSVRLEKTAVPVLGGIHRFEGIDGRKLAEKISDALRTVSIPL
ncbi:MAG: hypothetical protein HFH18_02970 [Ruminococcus sp.]|nr:hypothetical protein [Ruminococcus sp.]